MNENQDECGSAGTSSWRTGFLQHSASVVLSLLRIHGFRPTLIDAVEEA